MEWKLFGVAFLFLIAYRALLWVAPNFFSQLQGPTGSWGFYLVAFFALFLVISGFLPPTAGKTLRTIAYLLLFLAILLTEIAIVSPFVHKIDIALGNCTLAFFPEEAEPKPTHVLYNVVDYTSCILTGYYPKEKPETANVAWTSFYIFYLILPFAFIWTLLYGLMTDMGMASWFGEGFGRTANKILSFIIALYAARVLMGEVLLEFLGYGAWGLAAVFGAIFLVKGLQHMIESWFKIEEMAVETGKALKTKEKLGKLTAKYLKEHLDWLGKIRDPDTKITLLKTLIDSHSSDYAAMVRDLPEPIKNELIEVINANLNNPDEAIKKAKEIVSSL